ncbi:MAG: cell division protein SepF [Euzebya sp.]
MASDVFKRIGQFLGIVEEYEDDYADLPTGDALGTPGVDSAPPAAPRPEPSNVRRIPTAGRADPGVPPSGGPAATPAPAAPSGTVNVIGGPSKEPEPAGPRIVDQVYVTSLSTFNDVEEVGEKFRDGLPVLMNLQSASESTAKRLLDFASGLIYGLDGGIERTGDRIFLLTPADVDIATTEMDRLRDRGLVR